MDIRKKLSDRIFGTRETLRDQIPEDVLARAEKTGVTDIDWYAGRTQTPNARFTDIPPDELQELREIASKAKGKE